MKAREVLNRYANGERDFRRADLRGQSFKEQDLSGADFSEADIRGSNFSNTILKGANFTKALAGIQKHWFWIQQGLAFLISALAGFLFAFSGAIIAALFSNKSSDGQADFIAGIAVLGVMAVTFIAIARHGLTAKSLNIISISMTVAIAVAWIVAGAKGGAVGGTIGGVGAISGVVAVAFAAAVAGAGAVAGTVAVAVAGTVTGTIAYAVGVATAGIVAKAIAIGLTSASFLIGIYCSRRALKGDEEFASIRIFGAAFGATGGTAFCNADLTRVNFNGAILERTNFNHTKQQQTILEWVCWQNAKKLDYARVGNSILANAAVRELLVTRNGHQKAYVDANLRAANLDGVNLEGADLTWADLSCATLRHANLNDANLSEALVLHADFTAASITGACLEAWNIDSKTILEDVDCQYVYLLRNQQERRPSSGDFAPGEFTKLFQEALSTVDLIFRNGIDWKAFTYSFNQLVLDNDGTELSIQSIENKGDGVVVVRVNAPPDADKAKLHTEFNQTYETAVKALEAKYHTELKAKDEQITIYRQQSADMLEITRLMANRPVSIINENKLMNNSNDQSRNINVGGSVTGSTFNLGEISGNVTNTINQLQATNPQATELVDRLRQLQHAIETDPDLQPDDKTEALEQVGTLAKAGENPQDGTLKKLAATAVKILKGTIATLPSTATIVKACSDLLPAITKLLGL